MGYALMAGYENYHQVLQQMAAFGIELQDRKDAGFPKKIAAKVTCGKGGKDWYKVYEFERDGRTYLTGSFGTYRHGGSGQKIDVEWAPLSQAERDRQKADRAAAQARAAAERQAEIANAAAQAIDIWRKGVREGVESAYLARKQVQPEACRWLREQLVLRWPGHRPGDDDTVVRLVGGTLLLPLVRLDYPKHDALRGLQFITPDGAKIYLRGFEKPGCCVRLGDVASAAANLLLFCEGYATGLTIRMATGHRFPVFVAFDAGNLAHVVPLVAAMYPQHRSLICADDDWRTKDKRTGALTNPGRTAARKVAREVPGCDFLTPVFGPDRGEKDTDFNDLHVLAGLDVVKRQLDGVIDVMGRVYG
jgi:putative DNA primase/helicase